MPETQSQAQLQSQYHPLFEYCKTLANGRYLSEDKRLQIAVGNLLNLSGEGKDPSRQIIVEGDRNFLYEVTREIFTLDTTSGEVEYDCQKEDLQSLVSESDGRHVGVCTWGDAGKPPYYNGVDGRMKGRIDGLLKVLKKAARIEKD